MPALTETSQRFSFPSEPLRIPSDQIKSTIQWMERQESVPPTVANAIFATMWFLNVDAFRKLEDKFRESGQYEQRRTFSDHRAMLTNLIADGEALAVAIERNGIAATPVPFAIEDIRATVDLLQIDFQCDHGEKNSPEVNKIIEGIFDGEKR
jgi:hypothetical protein